MRRKERESLWNASTCEEGRRKRKRSEDIFKWLDVEERRGEEGRGERVKNYIYNSNTLHALYEGILWKVD